jgi:hypothetical protein
MNHRALKFLSILLVLCVLSIGGLAQAQSVEHAEHHAHHQGATHGTLLCSWMCAVGQGWEATAVPTPHELIPLESVESASLSQTLVICDKNFSPRGPPVR